MLKKTRVCKALKLAFGGSLAVAMVPVLAQTPAPAPTQLDRVEITGSSIRRLAAEQSLPVTVLKTDDLAKLGVTNAEQAVAFISSNQSSTTTTTSVGASTGGSAFANLRGLGDERTLVLVNGKRMVNNPYLAAAVDLNSLPFGAVERIEVLSDGASAIYGSDAIAGVINFITRKEYKGVSVSGSAQLPQASGGERYTADITAGAGSLFDQGWNIFAGFSWSKQEPVAATERDFAKTAYIPSMDINKTSGTTFPASWFQGETGAGANPAYPACDPPYSLNTGGSCRFDYVPFINIIPEQEQMSFIAKGSLAVNKDNTVSLEFIQANNTVASVISPTPVTGLSVAPTNPYYPGAGITPGATGLDPSLPVTVNWRQSTVGGRASEFENKTWRVLAAWDGSYKGWDYSLAALQSRADVTNTFTGGYVNRTMLQDGLSAGGTAGVPWLNPFGAQSEAGQAYLMSTRILGDVQKAEGTLTDVTARVSGEVAKLPAGSMLLAVGLEYFKDEAEYTNNFTLIRQAASSGLELAEDSTGDRNATAVMAELVVPVHKTLELNFALRYDDYSDFGNTTNPKVSFRWVPTQQWLVRGSYNTGFRAPTLYDVYAPNSITYTGNPYDDPLLCPGGVVNTALGGVAARDCGQQFQQQQGGNRNLDPETSKAWSLGAAFQPNENFMIGVDYWNYKVEDSIGVTGEDVIFGDPTKYGNLFVRCGDLSAEQQAALPGTCTGNPNILAYIVNTTHNLGNYKASGLDFRANWQSAATDWGRFSVGYQSTYMLNYEYQLEQDGPYNDNLGNYFNGGPVARYRQMLNFGWQRGAWSANLVNNFSSAYEDQWPNPDGTPRTVGSTNTWDLALTWAGVKGLTVTGSITNLFDQDPPFSNQSDGFQVGYDFRYANPIGRAFLIRGSYQF